MKTGDRVMCWDVKERTRSKSPGTYIGKLDGMHWAVSDINGDAFPWHFCVLAKDRKAEDTYAKKAQVVKDMFDLIAVPDTLEEEMRFLGGLVEALLPAVKMLVSMKDDKFDTFPPELQEDFAHAALIGVNTFPLLLEYLRAKNRGVVDCQLAMDVAKEKVLENLATNLAKAQEKPK